MDLLDPTIMSPMAIKALRITFLMVINQDQTIIMTMDHVKTIVVCDADADVDVDVEVDDDPRNQARMKILKIIKALNIKMTNKIKMINKSNNNNNSSQAMLNLMQLVINDVEIQIAANDQNRTMEKPQELNRHMMQLQLMISSMMKTKVPDDNENDPIDVVDEIRIIVKVVPKMKSDLLHNRKMMKL